MIPHHKDIVETASEAGNFTTLSNALRAANLVTQFKGPGPFTFFAPTDEAFGKLPPEEVEALLNDRNRLRAVLNYHALRGTLKTWDLPHGNAKTVEGNSITIGANDDGLTIDSANVTEMNILSSNGVIHAIDTVMMPGQRAEARDAPTEDSPWNGKRKTAPTTRR